MLLDGFGGKIRRIRWKFPEDYRGPYYDVWESEQDCGRFTDERLHPVVHPLLAELFGSSLPPEPERVPLPVIHVWGTGA